MDDGSSSQEGEAINKSARFSETNNYYGIHLKEYVEINKQTQGMIIKGNNINNPLLLFLHGGPGIPNYPTFRQTSKNLEEHFTVCYWDQRGTGMSFGKESKGFKSVEQLVEDTMELTKHLSEKYGKSKIYLLAHSWGTIIGARAAAELPDLYHAYLGIGQLGVPAKVMGSKKGGYLQILRKIIRSRNNLLERRYSYLQLTLDILHYPDLTAKEKFNILLGILTSYPVLIREVVTGNLRLLPFHFDIPVHFFIGNKDFPMTATLGGEYIDMIQAPEKGLYFFNESAHYPFLEEADQFVRIIKEEVLYK
ncbi:alpha/beta fold hydrolase [Sediminibacillus massiliensis]|uniref:alpha/beta fold hydrolase n=1 Tax=Sediminibacillus massiliensis TaxID=1926277 RepID=UPI0009888092|nr:alpha/beta hydrolase [Sediminibacillus massiliensis]